MYQTIKLYNLANLTKLPKSTKLWSPSNKSTLFGNSSCSSRPLSEIEETVLDNGLH